MGRPSLAEQRSQEILEAFGRCVARFGLEGSSLEKIAEEAGMRRSILRHYIGNRDELVLALAAKVIREYRDATVGFFEQLSDGKRKSQLIEFLLPTSPIGSAEQLLIIEALIGAASQYPDVKKQVFEYVDGFVALVSDQLSTIAPNAKGKECWDVAYALVCLSFNQESLTPLDLPPKYLKAARGMAKSLIDGLE